MAAISDLPGIDSGHVSALAELGLHTLDDLLRTERTALVRRLPPLDLTTVLRWQAIAALMQIESLTIADAVALVDGGVNGVDELTSWTPTRIRRVLPGHDTDTVSGWTVDAMRIARTGVVNGNVRLRTGDPVEGALVRIDGQELRSDARGRFRSIRLALDRRLTIEVQHPDLGFRRVRNVAVHRTGALISTDVVLTGRRQTPTVLSELHGDTLPPLSSAPMTTRQVTGPPDPRDVLVVVRTYANGDYHAASRFLDLAEGCFVRRTYRIPAAGLAVIPQRGDDLVRDGDGWRVTKLSPGALGRRRAQFAWQKKFPTIPAAPSDRTRLVHAIVRSIGAGG